MLIGQDEVVRLLLTGLVSGGHTLMVGVPGLAKTMMVKALADLPAVASARFVETEGSGRFNTEPDTVRALYRRRFDAFLSEIKANCQARGCDWYLAKTSDDPYGFLRNCFLARENGR